MSKATKKRAKFGHCGYCNAYGNQLQSDHVIARAFLRPTNCQPQDPIKIPACSKCNNGKSSLESYTAIMLALASDRELTAAQIRGVQSWPKQRREAFYRSISVDRVNRQWLNVNGILQDKVVIRLINKGTEISELVGWIAKGIIFDAKQLPAVVMFPNWEVKTIPCELEFDARLVLAGFDSCDPLNIIRDDGRYNNEIRYAAMFGSNNAFVYIQFYECLFGTSGSGRFSRTFQVIFGQ